MASRKKNVQVTIEIHTKEELEPYLQPTNQKVLIVNAYHPFWGRCEVAEPMLKKFQEEPANANKVDFVCCPFDIIQDIIPKEKFGAKPKFFIFVKGELFTTIQGIDLPKLKDQINQSYAKFEEVIL